MAPISQTQEIVVIVITFIPSILSIVGSSTIIYLATHQGQKRSVYTRLLLGMSVMDCVNTLAWLLQPFLIPASGGRIWAVGNDQSCQAMGFFSQLGSSVTLYNAALALYFWLTIVVRVREETCRKIEPLLHVVSVLYPLVTAAIGAGVRIYGELDLGMVCWVAKSPQGCTVDPDACTHVPVGWIFTGIPYLSSVGFMIVANIAIYCIVRRTVLKTMGHRMHAVVRTLSRNRVNSSESPPLRRTSISPDERKVRDVGIQSLLYVGTSVNTVIWMMFLRMIDGGEISTIGRNEESRVYWLLIMVHLTYPSQGMFNALIFIRPKYNRRRQRHPEHSRWSCFRDALKPNVLRGVREQSVALPQHSSRILVCVEQLPQDHADPPALKRDPLNHSALLLANDDDSSLSAGGPTSHDIKSANMAVDVAENGLSNLHATQSSPTTSAAAGLDDLPKESEER